MQKLISLILSILILLFAWRFPSPPDVPKPDHPGTETGTASETEPDSETGFETVSGSETDSETDPETDPETDSETDSETGTETESESETDIRESKEYRSLLSAGFPDSYALPLSRLLQAHPTWEFVPLDVTGLCASYTWNYVLDMEVYAPNNNLVPNDKLYAAMFREDDTTIYDSGYRAASRDAVAYYMDPRNFFNETDIFQFFDVSCPAAEETIRAVLHGTFMDGTLPGTDETYTALFTRVGAQYGISAAYLAVRGRMEHGAIGSPTALGTCGTAISRYSGKDESNLDGYYNFFNIGASGNGAEEILRNAVNYAMKGRDGIVWDSLEKSIAGGAAVLADRFVTNHQDTPYLLKFNVDARSVTATGKSRNFWGQHAQNIVAAYAEGRTLARAFAAAGATEENYRFLIPVYEGMPESATPRPGT